MKSKLALMTMAGMLLANTVSAEQVGVMHIYDSPREESFYVADDDFVEESVEEQDSEIENDSSAEETFSEENDVDENITSANNVSEKESPKMSEKPVSDNKSNLEKNNHRAQSEQQVTPIKPLPQSRIPLRGSIGTESPVIPADVTTANEPDVSEPDEGTENEAEIVAEKESPADVNTPAPKDSWKEEKPIKESVPAKESTSAKEFKQEAMVDKKPKETPSASTPEPKKPEASTPKEVAQTPVEKPSVLTIGEQKVSKMGWLVFSDGTKEVPLDLSDLLMCPDEVVFDTISFLVSDTEIANGIYSFVAMSSAGTVSTSVKDSSSFDLGGTTISVRYTTDLSKKTEVTEPVLEEPVVEEPLYEEDDYEEEYVSEPSSEIESQTASRPDAIVELLDEELEDEHFHVLK